jgi:pimeloyl-ACP methyl ester carboxylesterase
VRTDLSIALPDGRSLAYAEYGRPDGRPLLYFHGCPSCRLEPLLLGDDVFARAGVRVIAPDRPGVGRSSFQRGRGFADWPEDLRRLTDALGLERFAVLGNSGGAAYAAVAAARMPDRLTSAVIVSGAWQMNSPEVAQRLPRFNRLVWSLARHCRPALMVLLKSMARSTRKTPAAELSEMRQHLAPADFEAFAGPGRLQAMQAATRECLHRGARGAAWDMGLYVRPFDFAVAEVRMPITLFHGSQDRNVPLELVQAVLPELSGARLVVYPHEAHLSTLCNHIDEILAAAA